MAVCNDYGDRGADSCHYIWPFNLYNNGLLRFSGQRWWELKAHRYTELFDALFDVEPYTKRRIQEATGEGRFDEEYMKGCLPARRQDFFRFAGRSDRPICLQRSRLRDRD